MEKLITIAQSHSSRNPQWTATIKLEGGDPWFGYVWIDDVCHVVRLNPETSDVEIAKAAIEPS